MKPHLRCRLAAGAGHHPVPTWHVLAASKSGVGGFRPDVDGVLARHRRPAWIAHEYEPASPTGRWSPDERACGLDRTFRIVSQLDKPFPGSLVRELNSLGVVEAASTGRIGETPVARATSGARWPSAWAQELIGLPEAHQVTQGEPEVVVAVLDTGVDLQHLELVDCFLPGRDLVDIIDGASEFVGDAIDADDVPDDPGVGHGTHVSGIVAAAGVAMSPGVAPRCRVLPVRVLGALRRGDRFIGAGLVDNINNGIKWAVDQGASVINMSLGIRRAGGGLPHEDVIAYARRRGVVIVAAAGNDGTNELYYPGSLPGVLAIGAVDRDGQMAPFSTWGDQVDLVAPGTEIHSAHLSGGYAFSSGTSQASPFVAGAAALLRSAAVARGHQLSAQQVHYLLLHTADRLDQSFKHPRAGHGIVNVADALRLLDHRLDPCPRSIRPLARTRSRI